MEVNVKKIFNPECFHLLYEDLNNGMEFSIIKNIVKPPTIIADLCDEGMFVKYSISDSICKLSRV